MNGILILLMVTCMLQATAADTPHAQHFSDKQRDDASDFIRETLDDLEAHDYEQIKYARSRNLRPHEQRWTRALHVLCRTRADIASWLIDDEAQALHAQQHILTTATWRYYMEDPASVEHFEPLYRYIKNYNQRLLEQRLGKKLDKPLPEDDGSIHEEEKMRFASLVFLTVYLLNESYMSQTCTSGVDFNAAQHVELTEQFSSSGLLSRSGTQQALNILAE